jgi:flavodoxin
VTSRHCGLDPQSAVKPSAVNVVIADLIRNLGQLRCPSKPTKKGEKMELKTKFGKSIVIYYSHTSNTKTAALEIKNLLDADIFEIKPKLSSSLFSLYLNAFKMKFFKNHKNKINVPLDGELPNLSSYDTIFVGSPVYAYTIPEILASFLKQIDFRGKRVISFATYGGGAGTFFNDFKLLAHNAKVIEGKPFQAKKVDFQFQISVWLNRLEI